MGEEWGDFAYLFFLSLICVDFCYLAFKVFILLQNHDFTF